MKTTEQRNDWEKLPLYYRTKYQNFKSIKARDWFGVLEEFPSFIKYLKFNDFHRDDWVTFLTHDTRKKFLPQMDGEKWRSLYGCDWAILLTFNINEYEKLADEHDGWCRLYADGWKYLIKNYPYLKVKRKTLTLMQRFWTL